MITYRYTWWYKLLLCRHGPYDTSYDNLTALRKKETKSKGFMDAATHGSSTLIHMYSLYDMRLQGIMVVVFIKTNIQSKMMNKTTVIPCKRISQRELPSEINLTQIYQRDMIHTDLNSFWFSHAMTSTAYVIASNFRTFLFRLQNDQVATEKFCWYPRNAYQVKALQRQQNLLNELLGVQLTLTRMMN